MSNLNDGIDAKPSPVQHPACRNPVVVWIDTVSSDIGRLTYAGGVPSSGRRSILLARPLDEERPEWAVELLRAISDHMTPTRQPRLFLIPDSVPIRKAIGEVFGRDTAVQICRRSKTARVLDLVPKPAAQRLGSQIERALRQNERSGQQQLQSLAEDLSNTWPEASGRLLCNLDDCFTVARLSVPAALAKSLKSISAIGRGREWRHIAEQTIRSAGHAERSAAHRTASRKQAANYGRVNGYSHLQELSQALRRDVAGSTDAAEPSIAASLSHSQQAPDATKASSAGFKGVAPSYGIGLDDVEPEGAQHPSRFHNGELVKPDGSNVSNSNTKQLTVRSSSWVSRLKGRATSSFRRLGRLPAVTSRHSIEANAEELKLVQRLFFLSRARTPRTVVFSGVDRGSGCTRICARSAVTLASQVEGSVCVVDANTQHPALHTHFGVDHEPGLWDALLNTEPLAACVRNVSAKNLWVMPSGTHPHGLGAGVTREKSERLTTELSESFDYVLIDVPPLEPYGHSAMFARAADGVVIVVAAERSHREAASRVRDLTVAGDLCVLGAVLNQSRSHIPEWVQGTLF